MRFELRIRQLRKFAVLVFSVYVQTWWSSLVCWWYWVVLSGDGDGHGGGGRGGMCAWVCMCVCLCYTQAYQCYILLLHIFLEHWLSKMQGGWFFLFSHSKTLENFFPSPGACLHRHSVVCSKIELCIRTHNVSIVELCIFSTCLHFVPCPSLHAHPLWFIFLICPRVFLHCH